MSNGLIIVLIIVMWLFVLAPLLLRSQRPISKTGDAYDDTRVLYEGGSGELATRRSPRMRASDVHDREDSDYEVVAAMEAERNEEPELIDDTVDIVDGELVEPEQAAPVKAVPAKSGSTSLSALLAAQEDSADVLTMDNGGQYESDDTYLRAEDMLHEDARAQAEAEPVVTDSPDTESPTENEAEVELVDEAELTDEDVAFARNRSGRGGYDPDADRARSLDLYARRRRALAILFGVTVMGLLVGFVLGGWAWVLPLVGGTLLVTYLFALRSQVRKEQELRVRRIRHLRRARMGVRQAGAPDVMRRPGGLVVRVDDDSADFAQLTEYEAEEPVEVAPTRSSRSLSRAS